MPQSRMKLPLFDDYWIDFRRGTVRRWFRPEYLGTVPDGAYGSLLYDPQAGKYRLYYETLPDIRNDDVRMLRLAESDDLRTFTPYRGPQENIVWDGDGGLHGCSVLLDPEDPDPERRYKLCGVFDSGSARRGERDVALMGVEVAFSPDGIHFTRQPGCRVCENFSDSLNKLVKNTVTGEYLVFHRSAFGDRRVTMASSRDLRHWTEPRVILMPGSRYNDGFTGMQHYALTGGFFDGVFYGLIWNYHTSLYELDFSRMFGFIEPELVYSYDGQDYQYTSRTPLIERPYPPQPGCCGLCPQDLCESRDGSEYIIYCSGSVDVHGTEESNALSAEILRENGVRAAGVLYSIRKDGFCGIESVGSGGLVITKGIELLEPDLSFNLRANVGTARFGIMDLEGNFLDGFGFDGCVPFAFSDGLDVRPRWKEHDLREVVGRRIRVAVELNTAMLHCISATARPHVKEPQESFACPRMLIGREKDR